MQNDLYIHIELSHLGKLADCLAPFINRSDATISMRITDNANARLIARARSGQGCNAETFRHAMQWFHENWPPDLEWPSDVPRPLPFKTGGADAA